MSVAALALVVFDVLVPARKDAVRWLALGSVLVAMALSAWVMARGSALYGVYFSGLLKVGGH